MYTTADIDAARDWHAAQLDHADTKERAHVLLVDALDAIRFFLSRKPGEFLPGADPAQRDPASYPLTLPLTACQEWIGHNHAGTAAERTQQLQNAMQVGRSAYPACEPQTVQQRVRWVQIRARDGGEDLDLDQYLAHTVGAAREDFWLNTRKTRQTRRAGVNLVLDASTCWADRDKNDVREAWAQMAPIVADCEQDARPCRILALWGNSVNRPTGRRFAVTCLVVKHWHEPLMPAVFGTLRNNKTTNTLTALICHYLLGCSSEAFGWSPRGFKLTRDAIPGLDSFNPKDFQLFRDQSNFTPVEGN